MYMKSNNMSTTRRPKWYHHPPPPPTPKILHFPRRRLSSSTFKLPSSSSSSSNSNPLKKLPTLETLFDREEEPIVIVGRQSVEEDKWKFQAEMLRAECNLLRMEKQIALSKLDRTRSKMETTLRSALNTLLSGRIKISQGKNVEVVLDEEIHQLTEKLQRLHKRSGRIKGSQVSSRSNKNFDKQVSVLQRRLEKIGGSSDEIYMREFQEMEKVSLSIKTSGRIDDDTIVARGKLNVEILRRKMEGLSKGILLQRMEEEYNSLASSASTSKRNEFQDSCSSTRVLPHQEKVCGGEGKLCSGHCKTIVRRIMEQVRGETEQWSQMQEMLGQVREEMEELQASRDFWEHRAKNSHSQIQSLNNSVQEWRDRAVSSESKTNELEAKISVLCSEVERLRKEKKEKIVCVNVSKCSEIATERVTENELEKRVVVCSSKENRERRGAQDTIGGVLATKRLPFRDIGNSNKTAANKTAAATALLMRQNSKAAYPFHNRVSSNAEKIH